MPSKQQWQYFEFEPNIFDLWLFQKPINTILFLGLKILSISTIFFNLCRPLCVYARYICTNLIVYFVNKREDFLWKAPKWENEIYLKEMERPISLRLCKVYYSMAGRRNLYLPATQTCKDLNILCNNKPAIIAFVDNGFDTFL